MKILIVSSWYPPVLSGSSLWAESLVRALGDRGHDVRVVTTQWSDNSIEENQNRREIVYRLPARLLPRNKFILGLPIVPIAYCPTNQRRMVDIVRQFKPDIIHQINHIFDTLFLSARAARMTGTPLVGSITTPIQFSSPITRCASRVADLAVMYQYGVRHWQKIICSDSTQAAYVRDQYGPRVSGRVVTHIYAGVHQRAQRVQGSERTGWPQIVTVGHVHQIRDPSNLIAAMPAILKEFPAARLDIAGRIQFDRPVREVERLGLAASVRFLGEVNTVQVVELVSKAHVFSILHQCRYAGLSFTAIEAMYFGTPVIINAPADTYGPGMLRDGENIVLVGGKDVCEIAEKTN
jgi:glycosyltransferase involved in cell wall biosynthesis